MKANDQALPSVTVAVPTRNRAESLGSCLDSVLQSNYAGSWEVLVLDNASTDETPGVIASYARASANRLRSQRVGAPGLSNVRNAALAASSNDLIVFVDDDCYPQIDLITALAKEFIDPSVGYCGGRLLLHDPTDARFTIMESTERETLAPGQYHGVSCIPGTGMAVRRIAGLQVGGWDPLFGAGGPLDSGEDIDMYWRLSASGWKGVYTPEAVTFHHHGRKPGSESLKNLEHGYDIGRGAWYAKRLIDGPWRLTVLKSWWWRGVPHHSLRRTLAEIRGAIRYLSLRWRV